MSTLDMAGPSLSGARQGGHEAAAATHLAFEMDAAAMCLNDVAYNGEPKAGGADRARLPLREALEDPFTLVGWDAGAAVGDNEAHRGVGGEHFDGDPPTTRRVAQRIGYQVRKRPRELGGVAGDGQSVGGCRGLARQAGLRGLQGEALANARADGPQVDRLALQCNRHPPPARYLEQPLRHVFEPFDIAFDRGDQLARPAVEGCNGAFE